MFSIVHQPLYFYVNNSTKCFSCDICRVENGFGINNESNVFDEKKTLMPVQIDRIRENR